MSSSNSISNINQNAFTAQGASTDISIGNKLSNGHVGSSNIKSDSSENDKKTIRKNELLSLSREYKVPLSLIEDFIQKLSGKTICELDEPEYKELTELLLPNVLEMVATKSNKFDLSQIDEKAAQIKKMHEGGNSYTEISKFICEFENLGIFELLKGFCRDKIGDAKSARDVDPDVLAESLGEVLPLLRKKLESAGMTDGKEDDQAINTLIKHLLLQTKEEDILPIWEAFVKTADAKKVFNFTINALDSFADKGKLLEFVGKLKPGALKLLNLNQEEINAIQAIITNKLPEDKMADAIARAKEIISEVISKDPQLIRVLLKLQDANFDKEKANLTSEEQAVYDKYSAILDELVATMTGIAASGNQDALNEILTPLSELGIDRFFIYKIAELLKNNPDLLKNIDAEKVLSTINNATENKYKDLIGESTEKIMGGDSSNTRSGCGYNTTTKENYETAVNNVETLKSQIVEERTDNYTIEKVSGSASEDNFFESFVKTQAIKSVETFNKALAKGLIKIDDAGKDFNNACQSVQFKVLSFLDTQKNRRLDLLNKWHNSSLVDVAVNKFNFTKEQIEELKLSIGKREVLVNR